jgi:hypothetical protein
LSRRTKERLEDEYGSDWDRHGIPTKVRSESALRATENHLCGSATKHFVLLIDLWFWLLLGEIGNEL